MIIRRSLGLTVKPLRFEKRVAVTRTTVSGPAVMRPLAKLNDGKPYTKKVKPFNFILGCHVRKLGQPVGVDPEHFHLIAPYETDSRKWEAKPWINQYSSRDDDRYRISATALHSTRRMARVKNYGDVQRDYELHPEAKCADADGKPCRKKSIGLLERRLISIDGFDYIGKESNKIEQVEEGGVPAESDVYTIYNDLSRDEWKTVVLPRLRKLPLSRLEERSGLDRRTLQRIRAGQRPHAKNRALLTRIVLGC